MACKMCVEGAISTEVFSAPMLVNKQYWTDYPIAELGDKPGEEAPIRACKIISYDGDKYCKVDINGLVTEIKRSYIYDEPRRLNNGL